MNNNYLYTKNISCGRISLRIENQLIAGLIMVLFSSFASISAQPATISSDAIKRATLPESVVDERVMLITDRNIYLCGENIVFGAFIYEGRWFLPVKMSSILYVELYNRDNLVISKSKFPLKNGRGSGKISIPRDISSNIYYIRAYTNYMKNFGVQQFFTEKLKIVNLFFNNAVHSAPRLNARYGGFVERFEINLKTDKKKYESRENVDVMISTRNNEGLPVNTNLVLFTCLSGSDLKENDKHFPDAVLLNQELKQIFLKDDDIALNACSDKKLPDLVLICNSEMFSKDQEKNTLNYLPEMQGDIISGKLLYKDDQPARGIEILQSFTGKTSWIESSVTDINGNYNFLINNEKIKGI